MQSEWDVNGIGDPTIQGFATDISVNRGQTVSFKINTTASAYKIDIYRLGYYGGRGARKVATINPSVSLPQNQPNFMRDAATGLVDCGNWAVSASWAVPSTATSGVYIARPVRTDNGGASHIIFIVRNDASQSNVLFQTSDTTWHAYNIYGGATFYRGNGPAGGGRAYKVSYNRPFNNRDPVTGTGAKEGFLFDSEYPMIRWLEANGYDVSYQAGVDTDRRGSAALTPHKLFLSVGHDEYWSGAQRANVETARAAGVNLGFFSGNELYWKTRWENSIAGTSTAYRTLVCYKETWDSAKIDPTAEWTGTWRDPRFSPPSNGGRPENSVTGQLFMVDAFRTDPLYVSAAEGKLRFWRNTGIDTLPDGQTAQLPVGVLGFEWDEIKDNGLLPPGLMRMSSTTISVDRYLQDYGTIVAPGIGTHHLSLYRHSSGALVFGAGTTQWSWGLDATHDFAGTPTDSRMKQATVNLFADMGVQPGTLESGLVAATQSTDVLPPTSVISMPPGGVVPNGAPVTIIGTATDAGGGRPAGVEFSLDGGTTWHLAEGTTNWSATWMPTAPGPVSFRTRAVDDSGRIETPGPGVSITVTENPAGSSIWPPEATPVIIDQPDVQSIELGVRFVSDSDGWIKALRFYKCAANTGLHVGHLWANNGTLLATVTFSGETGSGWQEAPLLTPIPITAGVPYVASYHIDSGHFSMDPNFFSGKSADRPPLHALAAGVAGPNGLFHAGASGFPTDTWQSTNYWVDVVYSSTNTVDSTAPNVTAKSPVSGATGVSLLSSVTAQFNEDMAPWTIGPSNYSYPDPNGLFSFNPPLDAVHRAMLSGFKIGRDLNFTLTQVPNGTYDIYLWTFEDTNPLSATISIEGNVVGSYNSGQAGNWKRLGPYTVTITDGDIQARLQCSNGVALVSGLEVWQAGGAPSPTQPTSTFYRGINLGGPAMIMDGHNWEGNTSLTQDLAMNLVDYGSTVSVGNLGGIPGFAFNPAVDTVDHATMLRTYRWNHDLQFTLTNVPSGSYDVYVWTFEPNAPLQATLSIEQQVVLPNYNSGPAGHWDRLGPYPVDVADGNIQVRYTCIDPSAASFLSGVEVWRSIGQLTPPAGTFFRAINVGGSAMVVDGHNWEGEGTPNYKFNNDPYPFSLKDGQGNIVPGTITYDVANRTARLQPAAPLSGVTTYTATLKSGSTGLTDVAGNGLASDVTWTFSTSAATPTPTPTPTPIPQTATPSFNQAGGTYTAIQSVTLSDTSPGAKIYYTTNGTTPTTSSTLYSAPITVSSTTTIKAIAAVTGWTNSAVASATYTIQLPTPPAAPTSLTATAASDALVNLSWTDNASNETEFLVERKTGTGGTYTQIGTSPANVKTYGDTTVSGSTTYVYRVRASNAAGNSAYSNAPSVTTPAPPAVPPPWSQSDIGSTALAGSGVYANGTFTVKGSGADVWGSADAFHIVSQPMVGDGIVVARVVSQTNSDGWAKAGVMIRENLTANSKHAMMIVSPSNGLSFQRRLSTGGSSTSTAGSATARAPYWVGLIRSGTTVTAYASTNGSTWTQIGVDTVSMGVTVQVGLVVTAHNNSALSTVVFDNVTILPALAAPGDLGATPTSSTQINLTWTDNASSETGFKIERKIGAGGTYTQVGTAAADATSYTDNGLTGGMTYFYHVRATNASGDSQYSDETSATTPNSVPAAPTGLNASTASSSQINLSWSDVANETGFKIERKTGAGGTYSQVATVGANVISYSDTGLAANTTYYYRVQATNAGGDSGYSIEASATTLNTAPDAPSGLTATAFSVSQINLAWTDNSTNETGFRIERKITGGSGFVEITTVGAGITSFNDTGLAAGTSYSYRVRATNALGDSAYSSEASATTLVPVPSAPANLTATTASSSQINLSWGDVANETGYKIERKTGSGGTYAQIGTVGANVTTYSSTGLSANTTYFYRVRATNATGDSSYSGEANATTLNVAPGAPSGLSATATSSTQIDLTWTDVANETGFKIERKTGTGGTYAQIATVGANVTSYSSTGLTASTSYFYRVRATNAVGDSGYSNEASATTLSTPPAAPSGLAATAASSSQIDLSWTDNATNESGFKIERKTGSGGTYAEIATVGAGVVAYSDSSLTASTAYYYRVRATNAAGDSAYATEAFATTQAAAALGGLQGDYFNNADFTAYALSRVDGTVNFDWGSGSPDPAIDVDTFSVRWTGQVQAQYSQTYTFYTNSDDGVRLWVNGQLLVNNWTDHGPTENSGTIALVANQRYDIVLEYYENGGGAVAQLSWSSASQAKQIIPSNRLFPTPAAPLNLAATAASSSQIDLSWTDNATNESGFKIERKTGSGGTYAEIATVGAGVVAYSDSSLTASTAYYYRVRATNAAGDSAYATEAFATTQAAAALGGLQGDYFNNADFTAYALSRVDGTVNFDWGSGSPDPAIDVDTFSVRWTGQVQAQYSQTYTFYTNSDDGVRLWVNGQLLVNNWTDHGPTENSGTIALVANQRYDIVLEYYENGGGAVAQLSWSSASQAKQIIPSNRLFPTPAAPLNLAATAASSSQIDLSWTDNATNESGFKIERKTGSGGTYAEIATVGAGVVAYSDSSLAGTTAYYYRVSATNSSGDSGYSNEAGATTAGNTPAAPANLTATAASSSQINLGWAAVANETGYKIERKTGSGGTYAQIATVGANVTSYSNTGLTVSTTYFYRVRATNAAGDSGYSNEDSATTLSNTPAAPSGLSATATSTTQINITWGDVSNETGFKIERKTGSGGTYAQIATVGANVTSYNNTGLTASTTYFYRVRATNAAGDSGYSNEASDTTLGSAPAAPSGLTAAVASASQINLAWTDGSSNETGFKIERKSGSTGTYAQIATTGAGVTTYNNTGLSAGTNYYYRVRATNASGDSAYSNEANETIVVPAFRSASSKGATSGATSLVITKPSGTAKNDVLVASIAVRPSTATITAPSGWTLVRRINNANANENSLAVYYKVAVTGEATSYTWRFSTSVGSAGGIQAFTGVDTTDPIDVEAGQTTANGLTHAAPSVTTRYANDMIVTSHALSSSSTFTPPSGMTESFEVASETVPSSAGESIEGNRQVQSTVASTGTRTATASGDGDVGNAHTLALKPQ